MPSPTNEELHPTVLVIPKMTTTTRDLLIAELGTIIWNTTTLVLNVCDVYDGTANATHWGLITTT